MAHPDHERFPREFDDVVERLRKERAEATPVELDRMKLLAMKHAARGSASRVRSRRGFLRSRLVSPVLAAALLVAGVAALAGNTSGPPSSVAGSNASSANSEYCPASSPGAGKLKDGSNNCGKAP
jgi:hypothetical protein